MLPVVLSMAVLLSPCMLALCAPSLCLLHYRFVAPGHRIGMSFGVLKVASPHHSRPSAMDLSLALLMNSETDQYEGLQYS